MAGYGMNAVVTSLLKERSTGQEWPVVIDKN